MGWADHAYCRHRLVCEKWRSWGDAVTSLAQKWKNKWRRESVLKPTPSPALQIHLLSADCALWLLPRRSSGPTS